MGLPVPPRHLASGHERLLGLSSCVDATGDGVTFTVQYSSTPAFNVYVPFGEIGNLLHEIRSVAAEMAALQRLKLDRGADMLDELTNASLRPSLIRISVDPVTYDRLMLLQFQNSAPLTLRISPLDMPAILAGFSRAISASLN